jgi:MraZ protein
VFRGSNPAKIDDKGRLKVPTAFRRLLEERWGPDLFVTSVDGDSAWLYPLSEWEEIENRLAALPSANSTKMAYLDRVSYYGQQTSLDTQGRLVIPPILREKAEITGEVVVQGHLNHLKVWNHDRFLSRLEERPFTHEDFDLLSQHGI